MINGWLRARRQRALVRRRESLRRQLTDAIYDLRHWSFADRPSKYEDRKARIHDLIRRFEAAGGDALAVLDYGYDYLAAEAMPETFERVRTSYTASPYWQTVRSA